LRWPASTAFVLCVLLTLSGFLTPIEWSLTDMRAHLGSRIAQTDLTLVEIDPRSLRELDTWPWPRSYHARVLDNLRAAGAQQVFVDMDFSSTSDPAQDRRLAEALGAYPQDSILLPVFRQFFSASEQPPQMLLTQPAALFRDQVRLASITLRPERDGLVRRIPLVENNTDPPTVPAALLLSRIGVAPVSDLYIDYSIKPTSFPRLAYSDVMSGNFPRELVENRKIIIGAAALELGDQLAVPVYHSVSGPVLQALAYQSLRDGPLRPVGNVVTLLLMALLIVLIARPLDVLDWRKGLLLITGTGILLLAVSVLVYSKFSLIFSLAPLLLLLLVTYSFTVFGKLDQQALQLMLQRLSVRRKDALMANIVHNSIEGIVAFNADGAIRDINPAACSMFGLTRVDAVNRKFASLVPALQDLAQLLCALDPATNSAGVQETGALHCDGHEFPIEIAVSRLSFEGDELYTAFIRNISERNAQQAALRLDALRLIVRA